MTAAALVGQWLIGWLIADFLGGLVHWWEDRSGWPRGPLLDRLVLEPNRRHHEDPMAFAKGSFCRRNWTTFALAVAVAVMWLAAMGPSVVLLAAFIGAAVQAEVHYRAHVPQSGWVKVFQQVGIIQSTAGHARHHKPPQDRNYCVLTDWLNPILDHIGLWRKLERLFRIGTNT